MCPPIVIRKFRWADIDGIHVIERRSFGENAYDRNLFAEFFRKCGDFFLVAQRGGGVCGYIVTCTCGARAELVSVAVDPAGRGLGAASALLDSTLRRLRRRRIPRLVLMVRVTNQAARAFYEKYRFRKVRVVHEYYEDGEDGILMTREV